MPPVENPYAKKRHPKVAKVAPTAPPKPRYGHAQEAFITQSSHGIVPVVEIDGEKIGTGYPGEVTKKLIALYQGMPK